LKNLSIVKNTKIGQKYALKLLKIFLSRKPKIIGVFLASKWLKSFIYKAFSEVETASIPVDRTIKKP